MKIIWHLGFHKTGTTSIQAILAENLDVIAENTAMVIPAGNLDHPGVRNSKPLADAMRNYASEPSLSNLKTLELVIDEVVSWGDKQGYGQLVFSDEMALGTNIFDASGDVFQHAQRLLRALDDMKICANQVAVIYTRECAPWLQSAYAQSLKCGRNCLSFNDWCALFPQMSELPDLLADVQNSASFCVRIIRMEEEIFESEFLGNSLLQEMGVEPRKIVAVGAKNTRMPAAALEFLLRLNRSDVVGARYFKTRSVVLRNPELFDGL
ncbi:hypothetical protein [Yoonia sp. I 8.24]|uniref:hypothetical protein n=1 Tax=Yoonia sp. I 8.24 TaxID=1537229 RepID=UPI001EDF3FBD|nr:hypothetical protein [Yoonia sp. I 8.24]MCG3267607.1 hypothetical protein [Yoonia sp. I 8.24]